LVLKKLVERENDYVLIISLDSVNSSAFVEAYTPIQSPDSSTLSHIYLSADFLDTELLTFCNTTSTPSDLTTSASMQLTPYTNLFLSTKKKYKPITKKVCPVIGELLRSSALRAKSLAIHSTTYQYSTPTHHHSCPPTATPSSDEIS
jgi:hypothetical protein